MPKKVDEPRKNVENVEFKEKAVKSYKKQKEKKGVEKRYEGSL